MILSEWHWLEDTAAEECWLEVTFLLLLLKLGGTDLADDNDDDDGSAVDKPLEERALPEDVPSPSPTLPEI